MHARTHTHTHTHTHTRDKLKHAENFLKQKKQKEWQCWFDARDLDSFTSI